MQAIDCLVNVDLGDKAPPDWMVRVKDDTFKGDASFFHSPELPELLETMDAHGVDHAVLMTKLDEPNHRAIGYADARPDKFHLGLGGLDLLHPMANLRALESFVANHQVAYAAVGPSFWGDARYAPDHAVYYPLYVRCCDLDLPLCVNTGIPGPPLPAEVQDPIHLDRVCSQFPELKVCMIHGADPWWDTAMRMLGKYPNLRIMTSAWAPKRLPPRFIEFVTKRGRDRVIFGSDAPVLTAERVLGEISGLGLDDEVRNRWTRDNANDFFFGGSL